MDAGVIAAARERPAPEVSHIVPRWVAMSELLDRDNRDSGLAAFVGGGWWRSTRKPLTALRELLVRFPTVVAVGTPVGAPETFLGWIAVAPSRNAIVHCWVKPIYRCPVGGYAQAKAEGWQDEEFRVGSSLAILCGIDFGRPVECLTWSKAAEAVAAKPGNPFNVVRSCR